MTFPPRYNSRLGIPLRESLVHTRGQQQWRVVKGWGTPGPGQLLTPHSGNAPPAKIEQRVHGSAFICSHLPAFAPREDYVKLAFSGNPATDVKLRWLSAVTRAFQLQRDRAEVKMAAITSRFVDISRQRTDILERVQRNEFLALQLLPQDSPERTRKYPCYILTRYPIDVDPKLAERTPGVYYARGFIQNGKPINRIVVVWNLNDSPPPTISFDFLPCLSSCEVLKLTNDTTNLCAIDAVILDIYPDIAIRCPDVPGVLLTMTQDLVQLGVKPHVRLPQHPSRSPRPPRTSFNGNAHVVCSRGSMCGTVVLAARPRHQPPQPQHPRILYRHRHQLLSQLFLLMLSLLRTQPSAGLLPPS